MIFSGCSEVDFQKHKTSFESYYRKKDGFDLEGLKDLVFPLREIRRMDWKRGKYGDEYYSYFYQRFSCHILSRLALSEGQRILNIGCGFGLDEKNIKYLFPSSELWSVDISRFMLELAKKGGSPSRLSLSAAEALPFPDNSFDRVLCREVIEHVIAPLRVITEIQRVLKPRGLAVVTTVNGDSWSPSLKFDARGRERRWNSDGNDSADSIVDDPQSLGAMKRYIKESGLVLKEYFYDGALYFFLNCKQNRYKRELALIAQYFTCLENNRWIGSRFCDQLKYVLYKETEAPGKYTEVDNGTVISYVCPSCHVGVEDLAEGYLCKKCGTTFHIQNGIPEFIPDQIERVNVESDDTKAASFVGNRRSPKNGVRARVFSRLGLHYRGIYSSFYFLLAKLAGFVLKRNRYSYSKILGKGDPYLKYINEV